MSGYWPEPQPISEPMSLVKGLGGLHDIRVLRMMLDVGSNVLAFEIEDLLTNFQFSRPQHEPLAGTIEFFGIKTFQADLILFEGLRIDHAVLETRDGQFHLAIELNLGGNWNQGESISMTISFAEMRISNLEEIISVMKLAGVSAQQSKT